jgi:hypothetical protein
VAVGDREVVQVSTARFGHPQRVESKQAREHVVVATGQAGLHEERAEFVSVQSHPRGFLGDLGAADMHRR